MSDDKDGMAKNWEVVKQEFFDYQLAVAIAMNKVHRATGITRKIHHLWGLVPDLHRSMPRTLSYLAALSIPVIALAWWLV